MNAKGSHITKQQVYFLQSSFLKLLGVVRRRWCWWWRQRKRRDEYRDDAIAVWNGMKWEIKTRVNTQMKLNIGFRRVECWWWPSLVWLIQPTAGWLTVCFNKNSKNVIIVVSVFYIVSFLSSESYKWNVKEWKYFELHFRCNMQFLIATLLHA